VNGRTLAAPAALVPGHAGLTPAAAGRAPAPPVSEPRRTAATHHDLAAFSVLPPAPAAARGGAPAVVQRVCGGEDAATGPEFEPKSGHDPQGCGDAKRGAAEDTSEYDLESETRRKRQKR